MHARCLAAGIATLALAGCGPTHTGVVWAISDVQTMPDYERGEGWVLAVPDSGSARFWEAITGNPTPPEFPERIDDAPADSVSGWSELGAVALVGTDGGFDVEIEPGVYWICYGFEADDVNALRVQGCDRADVVPGEIEIGLVQGVIFVGTR